MSKNSSSTHQKLDDSLFEVVNSLIAHPEIYGPHLSKATIAYGAVYWPLWDGNYIFVSPEDKVMAIVSQTGVIPYGQKLESLEIGTVTMSIMEFQIQVLSFYNNEKKAEIELKQEQIALLQNHYLEYLWLKGKNWFISLASEENAKPQPDFEISLDQSYETCTDILSSAISEIKMYDPNGVFCHTISGNRRLRFNTKALQPKFEIAGADEFYSVRSKAETIAACREVMINISSDV